MSCRWKVITIHLAVYCKIRHIKAPTWLCHRGIPWSFHLNATSLPTQAIPQRTFFGVHRSMLGISQGFTSAVFVRFGTARERRRISFPQQQYVGVDNVRGRNSGAFWDSSLGAHSLALVLCRLGNPLIDCAVDLVYDVMQVCGNVVLCILNGKLHVE